MLKFINLVLFTITIVVGITFFTAKPPTSVKAVRESSFELSTKYFPKSVEVVGSNKFVKIEELFKKDTQTLLIVGNHDSMSVIKDLKKYFEIKIPYVMIANISNAPWFIKKWAIADKLKELVVNIEDPMIYDDEGFMVGSLGLNNTEPTKYFVYLVNKDGSIKNIYIGSVKEGALENGITEDEIKSSLKPILEFLK